MKPAAAGLNQQDLAELHKKTSTERLDGQLEHSLRKKTV